MGGTIPPISHKCRQNDKIIVFLPDVIFPEDLHLESNLAQAMEYSQDILIVVPSHAFGEILIKIKPHLKAHHRLIWATKGLERNTGRLLQTVVEEQLGTQYPLAVLSGPTFCKRISARSTISYYACCQ